MMNYYNTSLINRLFFASISGALVYPISFLEKVNPILYADISLIDIAISLVFALFVMVPFLTKSNLLKSSLMIISSIAIYTSMVNLTINNYDLFSIHLEHEWAITVSGGLGALLTGIVVKFIAPLKLRNTCYPLLVILGLAAGYIFSTTIESQSSAINAVGYIVWQTMVCLAISVSKK